MLIFLDLRTFHEKTRQWWGSAATYWPRFPTATKKSPQTSIFSWRAIKEKIVKNQNRALVFCQKGCEEPIKCESGSFPLQTIMESSSVSQIRSLKNFIETKINFSPSPLWFSEKKKRNMLWVLALTFHDFSPKPSLLIQRLVHVRKIIINPTGQVILAQSSLTSILLRWHIVTSVLLALCQSKLFTDEPIDKASCSRGVTR